MEKGKHGPRLQQSTKTASEKYKKRKMNDEMCNEERSGRKEEEHKKKATELKYIYNII